MPIVTVTAPPLATPADERAALTRLTGVVADALGLPPDGVFATSVASRSAVQGDADRLWPLVILHGGRREPGRMAAASAAAEASVAESWDADEVWVQWLVRD